MKLNIKDNILYDCELDEDWEDLIIPDGVSQMNTINNLKLGTVILPESLTEKYQSNIINNCEIKELIVKTEFKGSNEISTCGLISNCKIEKLIFDNTITPPSFCKESTIENVIFTNNVYLINYSCIWSSVINHIEFGKNLEVIDSDAFNFTNIEDKIILPKSLKYIGECAFRDIKDVEFKCKTLNYIDESSFYVSEKATNKFKKITIEKAPNIIIQDKIYYKHLSGPINIPEGIERVFKKAAFDKKGKHIKLPSTLKEIDEFAFASCINVKSVTLPENLEVIGNDAFLNCVSLEEIDLKNVKTIEHHAFFNCPLKKVKIPSTVELLDSHVFNNLNELEFLDNKDIDLFRFCNSLQNNIDKIEKIIVPKTIYKRYEKQFDKFAGTLDILDTESLDALLMHHKSISEINQIYKTKEQER